MMTKMTRYKPQSDDDEECTSVESIRTIDISDGTTRVHFHMGNSIRPLTKLEKILCCSLISVAICFVVLIAIIHSNDDGHKEEDDTVHISKSMCLTKECLLIAATVLGKMNQSVNPCEDFYEFSCGGFISSSVQPEGKATWGTLNKLSYDNEIIMKKVLESSEPTHSNSEEKAKIFYRSCIDKKGTIETRGSTPLLDLLKKAGGWSLHGNWTPENYNLQEDIIRSKNEFNSGALFSWGVAEDDKNSTNYVIQVDQGGLMLPARDYYLNKSEKAVADAYVKYITKIGVMLGASREKSKIVAKDVLEFETHLARFSMPFDKRRDDESLYHNMTIDVLSSTAPFMNWLEFINAAFKKVNKQLDPYEKIVVYAPKYLMKVTSYLGNLSTTQKGNTTIHNYLTWHIIKNYIGYLSKEFRDSYSILEKAQVGVGGGQDDWRLCIEATDAALGPALGAMYIRKAFSRHERNMATDMLNNIRKSFRENLGSTEWMSENTREAALDKADMISQMIGYPDYILEAEKIDKKLQDISVREEEYFENNINVIHYKIKENLMKLFHKTNKTKWDITPSTVNAYYAPTRNNIALPAGILQPPLFSKYNPLALNYGAVGVVMGHELSHAFDDQGRKYDKHGNLNSWWEPKTEELFKNKSKCMVNQYSSYKTKREHLKGELTLGENIADNGGLKASYDAYSAWLLKSRRDIKLPGLNLTPQQLFFLGFGQVWCSIITKEAQHLEIIRDSHVLPRFRVIGSLSNYQTFSEAYDCPLHSAMNPPNKCVVW